MSAPYIISPSSVIQITATLANADLQTITAGNPFLVFNDRTQTLFVVAAAMRYYNATTPLGLTTPSGTAIIKETVNSDALGVYNNNGFTPNLVMSPGFVLPFLVNYNPVANEFQTGYNGTKISLEFDGDYLSGDGDLDVILWGTYFPL